MSICYIKPCQCHHCRKPFEAGQEFIEVSWPVFKGGFGTDDCIGLHVDCHPIWKAENECEESQNKGYKVIF